MKFEEKITTTGINIELTPSEAAELRDDLIGFQANVGGSFVVGVTRDVLNFLIASEL